MRILLTAFLFAGSLVAQFSGGGIQYVTALPSTCNVKQTFNYLGTLYTCPSGVPVVVGGGGGGSSAFSAITGGTNTGAAMVVGNGASLGPSGTGTVNANRVNAAIPSQISPSAASPTPTSTTFLQCLNNAANQACHIVIIGDSFMRCDQTICGAGGGPTTATNRWPEQLRISLQAIYGSHGTGVYPVIYTAASTPAPVDSQAWSISGTYDTSTTTLGPTQSNGNTLVHLATGAVATFADNRNIPFDTLNVYCATTTSSGSIAVAVDGVSKGTACGTISGSTTAVLAQFAGLAATTHTVTLTSSGNSYLYAAEGELGTTGVSVDNVAVGGATAAMFGASATAQLAFTDLIPGGTQAFVIMDQTNDNAGNVVPATFSTNVSNIISHERALSSAPTGMLAIPPVDVVSGTTYGAAAYTAVQVGLCTSLSLTCVNVQSRGATVGSTAVGWGTAYNGSSGLWDLTGSTWPTGNAGIHPNDKGALDEFQLISAALIDGAVSVTSNAGGGVTQIAQVITSGAATSVTFSAIPGTFTNLRVSFTGRSATAATSDPLLTQFNTDTANNYSYNFFVAAGTSAPTAGTSSSVGNILIGVLTGANSGANIAGSGNLLLNSYAQTTFAKTVTCNTGYQTTSTTSTYAGVSGQWNNTAAVTTIKFFLTSGAAFVNGSTFTLYGEQ